MCYVTVTKSEMTTFRAFPIAFLGTDTEIALNGPYSFANDLLTKTQGQFYKVVKYLLDWNWFMEVCKWEFNLTFDVKLKKKKAGNCIKSKFENFDVHYCKSRKSPAISNTTTLKKIINLQLSDIVLTKSLYVHALLWQRVYLKSIALNLTDFMWSSSFITQNCCTALYLI